MRFLSLALRIFGFLIVVAIAIPVLVIAALQVPSGRTLVSGVVSSLASNDTQTISVEGIYLSFGLNATVEDISLADKDGVWLNAERLSLNWNPLQLLTGDLDISSISAGRIDLNRLPANEPVAHVEAGDGENDPSGGVSLPFNVSLESLVFDEINLGNSLIGEPVSLKVSGSGAFALDPAVVTAALDVHRVDGIDAGLTANAEFEPAAETLAFDLVLSEPRGGLAARLLDVPDLPAVKLALNGSGPLTDWAANLDVALDGRSTVKGSAKLSEQPQGRQLTFDLDGDLEPLAPPTAKAFLTGTTHATGNARFSSDFAPLSADIELTTQTVNLNANANLDNAAVNATGSVSINAGDNALIAVDMSDRRIAFGALDARFSVTGSEVAADWSLTLDLASFQTNEVKSGKIVLEMAGNGADLQPDALSSPFSLSVSVAKLEGLTPQSEPLSGALSLKSEGVLNGADKSVTFSKLAFTSTAAALTLSDTLVSLNKVSGQGRLSVADLAVFSTLAQRELGGSVSTSFSADLDPSTVNGSATAAISTRDLATGVAQADTLLAGDTQIDATLAFAGSEDVTVKSLSLKNAALNIDGNAHYQEASLASEFSIALEDLSKVDSQLAGSLDVTAKTTGPIDALNVEADAASKQIMLAGTPLDNLSFSATAIADTAAPSATIKSSASLNGQPIAIDVELKSEDGGADINPLSVKLAGNTVTGALAVADLDNPVETLKGNLKIDAPDLASLSPLLLTEIGGRLQGTVLADPDSKKLALDVVGSDIDVPSLSIGSVKLKADIAAPYTPQSASADIELSDLVTDATPVHAVKLLAEPDNGGTSVTADVKVDQGSDDGLSLAAQISQPETNAYDIALSELTMRYQGLSSQLQQPTTISYANGNTSIQPLELKLGNGSLALSGTAGQSLDLAAELNSIPLNLANAFVPSLGLGGTLSGSVKAQGSSTAPEASWTISGQGLTANELKNNGLAALGLQTSGTLKNNRISQNTTVSDPNGLKLNASGEIGLDQPNTLAVALDGSVPVTALKRPLLEAGIRGEGTIALKGNVGGSAASPTYQITATPTGLKITSLSTGLTVQNIGGNAAVTQDQASLNGITGELATGGSLSASGTVGMNDGFPANLALKLNQGRYVDPGLVTAEVDADIKITGPLASPSSSALIGGSITINKADISIPEYLPGAIPPVEVRHINASKAIRQQIADLGGEPKQSSAEQKSVPPRLDIVLNAPGRIFIRGRGLDAELQGNLKVVGTTADPQAIGAFSLKRGQLDILTRRLTFSRGSATFDGSLTPLIDFAATTTVNDTTITVTVSGQADDPEIAFSSSPDLPQDEVLALLLFGKSVGNLSATQIASLAAAIATLTGGSDSGPLATLRKSLGLDAIDINTDGEDGPSVAVGKYINDNIYLGVEQGTGSGSSRVKVDIDLDRGLKVRGEVGADGSSKAGIFFEREY
ncbi:MAG: translocation/assembly module TamB domain-containing protein [Rhodobacteraceae bacterium]|nr:translocation/assembly module TamB domain-containing protein [Paracoccaceae bacterium]